MRDTGAVAAVDCGTNSTRLLVAGPSGHAEAREMRITRLGQGVDATRRLRPEAMERTFAALREFRSIMDAHRVERARLVATSAVRDAGNGDAFLRSASEIVGVPAELLLARRRAGCPTPGRRPSCPRATAVVVCGHRRRVDRDRHAAGREVRSESLDIGCVRLTERFLRGDPPSADEVAHAVGAVAVTSSTGPSSASRRWRGSTPATRLVGWPGTVSTLAGLVLGLAGYDRSRIHHAVLPAGGRRPLVRRPGRGAAWPSGARQSPGLPRGART